MHVEQRPLHSHENPFVAESWLFSSVMVAHVIQRQGHHTQPKCEVVKILASINFKHRKESSLPWFLYFKGLQSGSTITVPLPWSEDSSEPKDYDNMEPM